MNFLFFKGFYEGIKEFSAILVGIINFILLLLVYIFGVGMSFVIAKVTRKKLMNLEKFDKKVKSYWIDKKIKKPNIKDAYRQF